MIEKKFLVYPVGTMLASTDPEMSLDVIACADALLKAAIDALPCKEWDNGIMQHSDRVKLELAIENYKKARG